MLRFRSPAVSEALRIPFRKVTVRKAIFWEGKLHHGEPTLQMINAYSRKVSGRLLERSISDLRTVERWIAPDDFYEQMIARCSVRWGHKLERIDKDQGLGFVTSDPFTRGKGEAQQDGDVPVISTLPMTALVWAEADKHPMFENVSLEFQSICTDRFKLPISDVYQTVYFPGREIGMYRATLTGPDLIIESIGNSFIEPALDYAGDAFGFKAEELKPAGNSHLYQSYGKIVPLPTQQRRAILGMLTANYGIYSLGRFATWRNILLDDVLHDIEVIRNLINSDHYASRAYWSKP